MAGARQGDRDIDFSNEALKQSETRQLGFNARPRKGSTTQQQVRRQLLDLRDFQPVHCSCKSHYVVPVARPSRVPNSLTEAKRRGTCGGRGDPRVQPVLDHEAFKHAARFGHGLAAPVGLNRGHLLPLKDQLDGLRGAPGKSTSGDWKG